MEVLTLIAAFARQQRRVADLLRARAALVGGIQHDVRTFATRLRLRLEGLPDPEDRARAETEIADLVTLMEGALLATRTQAGRLDLELIDLADLLETEVRDRAAEVAEVSMTVHPAALGAEILADRLALRRIAANLIDNALRYGKAAHLTLDADRHDVLIAVEDDGPGIPANRRAALLEPFTRLEPSRSRATGGAGLGLSIVRSLVDSHKGTLALEDAPSGGLRAVVRLPSYVPSRQG
jgi:signal transduction histidine kinase